MLAAALRAEADASVEALTGEVDEHGHRLVVRNGYHRSMPGNDRFHELKIILWEGTPLPKLIHTFRSLP